MKLDRFARRVAWLRLYLSLQFCMNVCEKNSTTEMDFDFVYVSLCACELTRRYWFSEFIFFNHFQVHEKRNTTGCETIHFVSGDVVPTVCSAKYHGIEKKCVHGN